MKARQVAGTSTDEAQWLAWVGVTSAPAVTATELVPCKARAVILAPHPDDEILMAGGLLQQLHQLGRDCLLIAVTDGESSHPGSLQWPAARLRATRPIETGLALHALGTGTLPMRRLALPDAGVSHHGAALCQALGAILCHKDVVFTTWSQDGHPDHDTCGAVAAEAAAAAGATLVEVPVWTWHWAAPDDPRVPWHRLRRLPLTPGEHARKQQAVGAFISQLCADPCTGRAAVLPASAQERLARRDEFFFL